MAFTRIRVTGDQVGFDALLAALEGIEGVDRVEEVADLMPHMDDDDSSSAGLSDDIGATDVHAVEIQGDARHRDEVRDAADRTAEQYGLVLEYVDEF